MWFAWLLELLAVLLLMTWREVYSVTIYDGLGGLLYSSTLSTLVSRVRIGPLICISGRGSTALSLASDCGILTANGT